MMQEATEERGEDLRAYLGLVVRLHVDARLAAKLDLSGILQQTLLEAHREGDRLPRDRGQEAAWLRKALTNNLMDDIRKLTAGKRDAAREVSLDQLAEESSARLQTWLARADQSPSGQAIRHEEALRLARSLEALPLDQRRAVELHHFAGRSLAEIAAELGRTKAAVAGLLHRGLQKLRTLLREREG